MLLSTNREPGSKIPDHSYDYCAVMRECAAKSKVLTNIVTTADYVAAVEHMEYAHFLHRDDYERVASRHLRLSYNKSVKAMIVLSDSLDAILLKPSFQAQCLCELAAMYVLCDTSVSDPVVFEVSDERYIMSAVASTCIAVFTVGTEPNHRRNKIVKMPRWAYDVLQKVLVAEASVSDANCPGLPCSGYNGIHLTGLGYPASAPSATQMESALGLWREAAADASCLYFLFSDALAAAIVL